MTSTPLSLRRAMLALLGCAAVNCALAAAPIAPVRDVVQTLYGVTVHDPYRYFENLKDPEVQAWLKGQGDYARQTLDHINVRDALEKRITELSAATGDKLTDLVRMPGERIYYLKRGSTEKQFKLVLRVGLHGAEKILVDPEIESARTGVPHAINYFVPSWDGKHVAYGMSAGGSEDASLYILNLVTGKLVGQPIARVHESLVSWLPDSQSLTFNQLKALKDSDPDTETYLDSRVLWLKLGQSEARAKPVFGPRITRDLGLARLDVGAITFTPGSPWMVARTTDTTVPEGFLFVARVSDLKHPHIRWKKISTSADKIVDIQLQGDTLYYRTHQDAPRYKVMKLDLRHPQLARAQEVATAPADGVLEAFVLTHHAVMAEVREGTDIGVRRYAEHDTAGQAIALPYAGAANLHEDPAHVYDDLLYSLSGWTQLPLEFQLRGDTSVDTGIRAKTALPAMSEVEVAQVKVPSYDG